jgi:alanyl-tRNA synthetase
MMKWYNSSGLRNEMFVQGQESELYRAKVAAILLDDALQSVLGSSARLAAAEVEPGLVRVHFNHPADLSRQQLRDIEIKANRASLEQSSPVCIVDEYRVIHGHRWIAALTGVAAVKMTQHARETLQDVADILGVKWDDVPDEVTKLSQEHMGR